MSDRQNLQSYHDIAKAVPQARNEFIKDYAAVKDDISNLEAGISPQFGTGTPEGVVTATASMVYYDITNSPASVTGYFNSDIGSITGWVAIV